MLAGSLAWSFPHLLACGEAAPAETARFTPVRRSPMLGLLLWAPRAGASADTGRRPGA
jgi:hypothetical protein